MKIFHSRCVLLAGVFLIIAGNIARADSPIQPGDRIAIVGNTFADQLRIHGYLETLLLQHSGETPVSIRNLGWGGDMLAARDRPTNFPTEESTLTAHRTDLIIACFGMGESFAGEKGIGEFKSDLEAFIAGHAGKKYNGKSEVRLILVSPIAYENLGGLTPGQEKRNRELEAYTRAMGEVAEAARIPFVDLYEPSRYLMEEPEAPKLTTNGIHLNQYGYWAISRILFGHLVADGHSAATQPWNIRIDARAKTGEARGVGLSGLTAEGAGVRFAVKEESGPTLAPPIEQELPSQLANQRDSLVVVGLEPGDYTLTVDGETIVTAGHDGWAKGIAIDFTPAHRAAESVREAINDKNLQFTYGWKALNQVHIVGERRKSPSGRALPAEVIEFHKLADQRDEALRGLLEFKTREWQLVPTRR